MHTAKKTTPAGISLLALLSLSLLLTTCTLEPQIEQLLEDVIDSKTVTYTVTTDGNDTATSTKLMLVFSSDPGTLAAKDITLADGTGSASQGTLSGTDTTRTLGITPIRQGTITVKITKAGIESAAKTVEIFKKADTVSLLAIGGVSVPVTGEKPVTTVTETAQYTGTVTWTPNDAVFAASTAYTAKITLTPKSGYTLSGVGANTFTVAEALSVTHAANSGIITAVFSGTAALTVDTTVNLLAIGGVTVPVTGAKPVTSITQTAQYSGTVTWTPNDAVFAASTAYTAKITLTAKSGYTLIGVEANAFTVAGALVAANPVNSGVVTATFPATAPADTIVNIRAIAGVTVPVTGGKPVTAITETAQYSGTVSWQPNDAVFAASTAYTAKITLTTKSGYTLSGVGTNTFTVTGALSVTNPANSGVVTATFPATAPADTTINLRAIAGVTVPATGGKPVTAITETAQYSGTVTWAPNDAAFAASTAYTATIVVTPKASYTLTGVGANTFTVAGASSVANPANSGVITAVFPATASVDTTINIRAISGVTVPVTGGIPVTTVTETAQYSGTVTWAPNNPVFAASTEYTAKITLTAKPGYTLSGVGSNAFTVAGASSVSNPPNSGVITAAFPATAPADTTINLRAIAGVTVPVTGGKPVTAITETAQYSGTVSWAPNNAVFAASTVYTATIVVTPKAGYTLSGVGANTFTVAGASTVANSANSGVVTATFPATDATVSLLAIGGITVPATGGKPVTAITETAQYTGTVTWTPNDVAFVAATAYTATIAVTPKAGYTLTGVGANTFTVAGVSTVANPANSGVVTATFPATAPADTTINLRAIAGVTVPATGGKPVTAITETAQYTGTVTWTPNDAVFAASTAYTAKITLTAKSGYTLSGVGADTFTVAGALSVANPANSGVVTATFPATAAADTTINLRAIAGVTVPVTGGKPVTSITDTTQYSGTVTWSPNVSVFAASTAYTATIVVTAKPGYTLIGMGANTFTVAGALSVTHAANSGVITAIFPATDATVSLRAIGGVTVPVAGGVPATSITETAQYSGVVTWTPSSTVFVAGTAYTAIITLAPKAGYTLTGVGANTFTVAGATTVTNPANSGVITAVFPFATAANTGISCLGLTPGSTITDLNFNWHADSAKGTVSQVRLISQKDGLMRTVTGTVSSGSTGDTVHRVSVNGLDPDTWYRYSVSNDGTSWNTEYSFKTANTGAFSFAYIGDPQVVAANTSVASGWQKTVTKIAASGAAFIASAGDQINGGNGDVVKDEAEYPVLFAPNELRSIPLAPAVGNHDVLYHLFKDHFNLPNEQPFAPIGGTSDQTIVEAAGNYWYLCNNALFVVLNTAPYPADSNVASYISRFNQTISAAVNANQGKYTWLFVQHHKSTKSIASHSADSDINRYITAGFEKLMDTYKVDFVLAGHDHVYARSYTMLNGSPVNTSKSTIINPGGTIYLTANSSSGGKFYDIKSPLPSYNNVGIQDYKPEYTIVAIDGRTVRFNVYDNDSTTPIDSFSVSK